VWCREEPGMIVGVSFMFSAIFFLYACDAWGWMRPGVCFGGRGWREGRGRAERECAGRPWGIKKKKGPARV
jgi:hypothetical protein